MEKSESRRKSKKGEKNLSRQDKKFEREEIKSAYVALATLQLNRQTRSTCIHIQ